jgi:opacity protein-like surface antigen
MKIKNFSALVVGLLTLIQPLASHAQQDRFYINLDGGIVGAKDVKINEYLGVALAPNAKITFDPGIHIGFRAGYGFTDWLAGEIETGITANSIETITGASEANGSLAKIPFMLNARFHLPHKQRVTPYFGAGAGVASSILTANDIVISTTRLDDYGTDAVFVYQAFAGIRVELSERTALNIGYKYLNAGASNLRVDDGLVPDRIRLGRSETHAVTVGIEWNF